MDELTVDVKRAIVSGKVAEIQRAIYSLTIDAQAAKMAGNTDNNEKIEKAIALNLKLRDAYEKLLGEIQ